MPRNSRTRGLHIYSLLQNTLAAALIWLDTEAWWAWVLITSRAFHLCQIRVWLAVMTMRLLLGYLFLRRLRPKTRRWVRHPLEKAASRRVRLHPRRQRPRPRWVCWPSSCGCRANSFFELEIMDWSTAERGGKMQLVFCYWGATSL